MKAAVKVVGMIAGERRHIVEYVDVNDLALMVPEPDNPHDPNAIAVHVAPRAALNRPNVTDALDLDESDRQLLMDRQAGYVPRDVAARFALPPQGLVGVVHQVRYHPEDGRPVGLDVVADWPRRTGRTPA